MPSPILLTRTEARELLAGIDPAKVAPPIRFGRNLRWSRAQLEAEINARAGMSEPKSQDTGTSYDAWKEGRA